MAAAAGVNAGFTYGWASGASWDINANWSILDSQFMLAVISMALTTPPSSPANGDRYAIPTTGVTPPGGTAAATAATGAWANYNGYIARYNGTAWEFVAVKEGWRARNRADSRLYHNDGAGNWLPTNAIASVQGVSVQYNSVTFGIRQLDFGGDFVVTDTGSGYIQVRYGVRYQVNDANYQILTTDRGVSVIALTAARTLTLPLAANYPPGARLRIVDESQKASGTLPITISPAVNSASGASTTTYDTVNYASGGLTINRPGGYFDLQSNGSTNWTVVNRAGVNTLNASCQVTLGSTQSIPVQVFTRLKYNTIASDPGNNFDTTNNWYVCPRAGLYLFTGSIRPNDNTAAGTQVGFGVYTAEQDGAFVIWNVIGPTPATRSSFLYARTSVQAAGDKIRMYTYSDQGYSAVQGGFNIALISEAV